jgi:hypothetical protein
MMMVINWSLHPFSTLNRWIDFRGVGNYQLEKGIL